MATRGAGTNGGAERTGGDTRRRAEGAAVAAAFVAVVCLYSFVNGSTALSDLRGSGIPDRFIWSWEISSSLCWVLLGWPIWHAVRLLRPPRVRWTRAVLAHLGMTLAVSALHIAGMVALRKLFYVAMGEHYVFSDDLPASLLYEYRKDFASYLQIALLFGLVQWVLDRRREPPAAPTAPRAGRAIEIADGNVVHRVPVDAIDWRASAGNYVELAWGGRRLLHRATLAGMAELLGDDFVRIHRGRLVRRAAIARVEADRSGDFAVTLATGATLRGSRRHRGAL